MTRGLILAAGRGSRLGPHTEARPKGMVALDGCSFIEWQLEAMRTAGIDEVFLVTGYRAEMLQALGLPTRHNPRWAETNMVASLLCAADLFDQPVVVSYSDIVYDSAVVSKLLANDGDLGITYDRLWRDLWSRRFDDPLSDAETFRVDSQGLITEIGQRTDSYDDIQGQYMGLLRISPLGLDWCREVMTGLASPEQKDTLDMTSLLQKLIGDGKPVAGIPVSGGWCEVDDAADLKVAEDLLAAGLLEFGR